MIARFRVAQDVQNKSERSSLKHQAETVIEPWEPSSGSPPSFVHAYRWWRTHTAGRLPSRSDFHPVDHRSLLGRIVLFDVVRREQDTDFRYRLWGSDITTLVRGNAVAVAS